MKPMNQASRVSFVVPVGQPDRPLVVERYYAADKQAIDRVRAV